MTMMTSLHIAAASGDIEAVREELLKKPSVDAKSDPNGFTPLHVCVSGTDTENRQEIIRLLCAAGADLEAKTYDKGLTPLQLAAMRDKPLCVAALINCGADVHATEGNKATALHGSAFFGYLEVTKLLLEAGANPELADRHGNTPISLAKSQGHKQVCDRLNNPENKKSEKKALHMDNDTICANERLLGAANSGDIADLKIALETGADPNAKRQDGVTALMLACLAGHPNIVQALLENSGETNAAGGPVGAFPLLLAAQEGHTDIVKMLLKNGVDVRAKANDGKTALMAAALDGRVEILRILIDSGATINEAKEDGFTPLMLAAFEGHADVAQILLEHGADLSAIAVRGTESYNAKRIALVKERFSVVKILEEAESAMRAAISDESPVKGYYILGSRGPAGGIVFLVDSSGHRGLEAKELDDGECDWPRADARARAHGDGWRLPTLQELLVLFQNEHLVGGFCRGWYWSSSEEQRGETWWAVVFSNGNSYPLRKHGDACYVRAVRDF